MSAGLEPCDKHPASPGALQAGAGNLVAQGAEALQHGDATEQSYSPAIVAVTGDPAPAVAAASDPVLAAAGASSSALVWAGVVLNFWGGKVAEFNRQVEIILANLSIARSGIQEAAQDENAATVTGGGTVDAAASQAAVDDAVQAAVEDAKREWHRVHLEHILNGGNQAPAMLQQGPTETSREVAREVGAMPEVQSSGPWGWLDGFLSSGAAAAAADGARRGRRPGGRLRGPMAPAPPIGGDHRAISRRIADGHA